LLTRNKDIHFVDILVTHNEDIHFLVNKKFPVKQCNKSRH